MPTQLEWNKKKQLTQLHNNDTQKTWTLKTEAAVSPDGNACVWAYLHDVVSQKISNFPP